MTPAAAKKLQRTLDELTDLEEATALLAELQQAQATDPDEHAYWELRLRLLRRIGALLPPKHTGHGGAADRGPQALDRRLAYKARLLAGLRARRFERALRDWEKEGRRPNLGRLIKLARQERGEDPQLLLRKVEQALTDLERAVGGSPKNERALVAARRALSRLELEAEEA
ncbi:MAG: hypothetical protein AB7N76_02660 [Planctomycetota bacterium]